MVNPSNPRTQTEGIENGVAHSSGIQFHISTSTVTHSLQNTIPFLSSSPTQIPLFQLQNVYRDRVIIPSDSLHHPPGSTRWTRPDCRRTWHLRLPIQVFSSLFTFFFCVNFIILLKSLLIFISFVIVDSPQRKKQKKEKKKENFFLKKVLLEWIIFRATKRSFSLSCLNCYIWRIYLDLYMDLQLLRENPFIWQN